MKEEFFDIDSDRLIEIEIEKEKLRHFLFGFEEDKKK